MRVTKNLLVGVAVCAVLLGGAAFAFLSTRSSSGGTHSMQILFTDADGLVSGSDVLEAGSKVGYISAIEPEGTNALVTLQIDDANWPLHQGATADIRPKSLLGEKYVDLHDGKTSGAVYDASVVMHASNTADPVELDQFINSLDPTTRTAIRVLLDDLGAGVAGRGDDLNSAISAGKADLEHLAVTGKTLDARDPNLDRILVGLDSVLSRITTDDQLTQMSQLITNGQNTLNDIEDVQGPFSRSFTDANITLNELNTAFDSAVPSLRSTLDVAPSLFSNLSTESALLAQLGEGITTSTDRDPTGTCNASNPPPTIQPLPKNLAPCSPLWMTDKALLQGPTVSGGALELPTYNPIFRICLSNAPATMFENGSCDNSAGSQPSSYTTSDYNAATLFAGLLGT
jgi:phospholipid/cholesterol/gamma-HCH transport system substrate-binding protein